MERFTSLVTASSPAHHTIFSRKAARTDDKSSNACSAACRAGADGVGGSGVRPRETAEPRSLPCGSSIEFEMGEPNSASISSFISRTAAATRGGNQRLSYKAGERRFEMLALPYSLRPFRPDPALVAASTAFEGGLVGDAEGPSSDSCVRPLASRPASWRWGGMVADRNMPKVGSLNFTSPHPYMRRYMRMYSSLRSCPPTVSGPTFATVSGAEDCST